jgi:hypothetical protein
MVPTDVRHRGGVALQGRAQSAYCFLENEVRRKRSLPVDCRLPLTSKTMLVAQDKETMLPRKATIQPHASLWARVYKSIDHSDALLKNRHALQK